MCLHLIFVPCLNLSHLFCIVLPFFIRLFLICPFVRSFVRPFVCIVFFRHIKEKKANEKTEHDCFDNSFVFAFTMACDFLRAIFISLFCAVIRTIHIVVLFFLLLFFSFATLWHLSDIVKLLTRIDFRFKVNFIFLIRV